MATKKSDTNPHRVAPPVVCPPRGPCESLPRASLWENISRVLYLHDNAIPKKQLWRNGRKPGEVIGCRLGSGGGICPMWIRAEGGVVFRGGSSRSHGELRVCELLKKKRSPGRGPWAGGPLDLTTAETNKQPHIKPRCQW